METTARLREIQRSGLLGGKPMGYAVQRRWHRLQVTAPVTVEFLAGVGASERIIAGSTRDFGAGGVYVVSQERMRAGAQVRVRADLPHLDCHLDVGGAVVRCEEWGFAVAFDTALEAAV